MTLAALKEFEPLAAGQILADLALAEAPDPGVRLFPDDHRKADVQAVRHEIRARLNLADDDVSSEAKAQVNNAIFDAIKATVLGQDAENAALGRLGQAGAVPPHFYEPVIPREFMDRFSGIGVKKSTVEDAITNPDNFEHVWADAFKNEKDAVISLFLKRQPKRGRANTWLLVQALRQGIRQVAQAAWFIFDDEFDVDATPNLIDLLEKFAAKYGVPLSLNGTAGTFIREIKSSISGGNVAIRLTLDTLDTQEKFHTVSAHILSSNDARIGIAYAISMPRYRKYLLSHGVIR